MHFHGQIIPEMIVPIFEENGIFMLGVAFLFSQFSLNFARFEKFIQNGDLVAKKNYAWRYIPHNKTVSN